MAKGPLRKEDIFTYDTMPRKTGVRAHRGGGGLKMLIHLTTYISLVYIVLNTLVSFSLSRKETGVRKL